MKLCAVVSSVASAERTETSTREERSLAPGSASSKNTTACFMLGVFLSDGARMEAPSQSVCKAQIERKTSHARCNARGLALLQLVPTLLVWFQDMMLHKRIYTFIFHLAPASSNPALEIHTF